MNIDSRLLFCGVCFGIYPVLAGISKLESKTTFSILSLTMLVFALPLLQGSFASVKAAPALNVLIMVVSALLSVIGVIVMFRYLADTPENERGSKIIIMVIVQVVATWTTSLVTARTLPTRDQVFGLVCAVATVYFLRQKTVPMP